MKHWGIDHANILLCHILHRKIKIPGMPLHQQPGPDCHAQMKDIRIRPDFLGIQKRR